MTNCCNDYGNCTQGNDCPARSAYPELVARIKASHPAPTVEEIENLKEVRFVVIGAACIAALCIGVFFFGGK